MSQAVAANYLAVEIGGTKLQLAIGACPGESFLRVARAAVNPERGADGILAQISELARPLVAEFSPVRAGIGFGGPVDPLRRVAVTSHQIDGWAQFPLGDWFAQHLNLETTLANDCDAAAFAEAVYGAGRGAARVFYVTVGTGVGGGFVTHGELQGRDRPAIAEIGHLRVGLDARRCNQTVESLASGWGIGTQALEQIKQAHTEAERQAAKELTRVCLQHGRLDTRRLATCGAAGNLLARRVFHQAAETLGWAIAQMLTLVAADVVVLGGGVMDSDRDLLWNPLCAAVETYVFPPLAGSFQIRPAALGAEVVLQGALALALAQPAKP